MLTLITASPGSGKTQFAIQRYILEVQKLTPERAIYSNIKGLRIPGVELVPDDWQTTPEGSLCIYDEAQQEHLFPATGVPGNSKDSRIARLDTHRHKGYDIVVITQDAGLLHHHLRKFVGRHIHLTRPNGAEQSTVYTWDKYQPSVDDYHAKQGADTSFYKFDPAIWKLYDSATIHTHKFEMPKGVKWAIRFALFGGAFILLLFFGFAYWNKSKTEKVIDESPGRTADTPAMVAAAAPPLSEEFAWRSSPTVAPIAGCVASERRCRCFDTTGWMLDLKDAQCRNLAEGNVAMPINLFGSAATEGGREGRATPPPGPAPSLL